MAQKAVKLEFVQVLNLFFFYVLFSDERTEQAKSTD